VLPQNLDLPDQESPEIFGFDCWGVNMAGEVEITKHLQIVSNYSKPAFD